MHIQQNQCKYLISCEPNRTSIKLITNLIISIVEPIRRLNSIWFIGDDFLDSSFGKYFQLQVHDGYVNTHYEVKAYSGYKRWNRSYVVRIRNCFAKAVNDNKVLPRYVVVIIDNEIISSVGYDRFGVSEIYERLMNWLANELDKLINVARESLPKQSLRGYNPR